MSVKLRALQAKKVELVAAARKFNDETDAKAQAENRGWTEDETKQYEAMRDGIAATQASIEREQALIAEEAGLNAAAAVMSGGAAGAQAPPAGSHVVLPTGAHISVEINADRDPTGGFASFGEFAAAVRFAGLPGNQSRIDPRLAGRFDNGRSAAAPGSYGGEGVGTDGGFAIPPVYSSEIFTLSNSLDEGSLLPLTDNVEIESNAMAFPKDETTPWGTDGIRAYWQSEAQAGTATKPKLGLAELRMKKLMALVPVSDELLADGTALNSFLPGKMAASIRWKINEAILFGTGAGQPMGAFNSGALITVAKETGQATLTLQAQNVAKMVARLPEGSFPRAVWLINNDVLPALFTLTLGNYPIYLPAGAAVGGIQGSPYGTLLGRPIYVSQHAKSFSSQGDVLLADLSYYRAITKAGGVQIATSMHLYFDADATAFRAIVRLDGQSKIAAAINPANGSNQMSPFVQLGAR